MAREKSEELLTKLTEAGVEVQDDNTIIVSHVVGVSHYPTFHTGSSQCAYCKDNNRRPSTYCIGCKKNFCIKGKIRVRRNDETGKPLVHSMNGKPQMCNGEFGQEPKIVKDHVDDDSIPTAENPNCWLAYHLEFGVRLAQKEKADAAKNSKKRKITKKKEGEYMDLSEDVAAEYHMPAVL